MNVPSLAFVGFALTAALLVNVSHNQVWRRCVLLIANLAFAATFIKSPAQAAPFAGLLAFGYAFTKLLRRQKKRQLFVAIVAVMVLAFCWLKQYSFIPHAFTLHFVYATVGMSYVFFRVLHLVIDSYQDALPDDVDPVSYLNFTLHFAALVSGPIQLYSEYRKQEMQPAQVTAQRTVRSLERVVLGFLKVSVVSPYLAYLQTEFVKALSAPLDFVHTIAFFTALLAVFPVYLYFNFSGYMDVVVGLGHFLGFDLPENFDRPFIARNFIEMWSRWHITLSMWLKTYVYSPLLLRLMKTFPSRSIEPWLGVISYFVTFFLIGVWHGQTTMFLFFGFLQGLGVSVNKVYQIILTKRLGRARFREMFSGRMFEIVSCGLTFTWFAITMLWFWSSWHQLGSLLLTIGAAAAIASLAVLTIVAGVVCVTIKYAGEYLSSRPNGFWKSPYYRTGWVAAAFTVVLTVMVTFNAPAPHIVYKGF